MNSLTKALASAALLATAPAAAAPLTQVTTAAKRAAPGGTGEVIGIMTDPAVNRDSCMSAKFGTRQFWICRDTAINVDGKPEFQIVSSTASWTDYAPDGSPLVSTLPDGSQGVLAYGGDVAAKVSYFARPQSDCPDDTAGGCGDGTRFPAWPDAPPMVVGGQDGGPVTAYNWVRRLRIKGDFSSDEPDPATALYKITYDPALEATDKNALPTIEIANESFWPQDAVPFGVYGHAVKDGVAYLWGQPSNKNLFLAKVPADSVEDITKYEYWVNGSWGSTPPAMDDANSVLENGSAGGQGTYYYSEQWQKYVWIGQGGLGVSPDFLVTTAPDPTGPWDEPVSFYQGVPGSANLAAYTLQAHPGLVPAGNDGGEMYISYTKADRDEAVDYSDIYETPMIKITWTQ
ncbi:hypothetical protein N3K66_007231 [Trichothecium roseum]|uniref:Uncharacterized protein n=1 Tax=Trichothecium roseum TaxID=47278 RepID=A0ACC0UUH1_9HYPO|nr:hypothetical protein N3K66_007231 [Trichothecium roseum]